MARSKSITEHYQLRFGSDDSLVYELYNSVLFFFDGFSSVFYYFYCDANFVHGVISTDRSVILKLATELQSHYFIPFLDLCSDESIDNKIDFYLKFKDYVSKPSTCQEQESFKPLR